MINVNLCDMVLYLLGYLNKTKFMFIKIIHIHLGNKNLLYNTYLKNVLRFILLDSKRNLFVTSKYTL